jgi:uncharacterized protein YjiS (DUF1127 family)
MPRYKISIAVLAKRMALTTRRVTRPLRRLLRIWAARRQEARDLAQIDLLDAQAMRDLGLSRSELASVFAEACQQAEQTRRRLAPLQVRVPGA